MRRGKLGRPLVPREIRELLRTMSRENPMWGSPHIHRELLKLGIDIGEASVSKKMIRRRRPPSQTWKTFLENDVKSMAPSASHLKFPRTTIALFVVGVGSSIPPTPFGILFFYRYRHTDLLIQEVVQWGVPSASVRTSRAMRHEIHFSAARLCDGIYALRLNAGQKMSNYVA